ncbi:MAG: thiamine phosphate synthase [Chlorobium sp.]
MIPASPFLCVITDEALCPVTLAQEALKGGAAMIQLRHKSASGSQLFSWAVAIGKYCQQSEAIFIVNDRLDIAMASGADGVHLGQEDMPAITARKIVGKNYLIGVSAASIHEALEAEKDGADYVGFGHIYPTSSKEKRNSPVGIDTLQQVSAMLTIPILAIGGINSQNAGIIISSGASGVAVISAISRTDDPLYATRKLVDAITTYT